MDRPCCQAQRPLLCQSLGSPAPDSLAWCPSLQMDLAGVGDEGPAPSATATDQGNAQQPALGSGPEAAGVCQHEDVSTSDQQQQTLMKSEQQPQSPADASVLGLDQEATQVYNEDARAALAALGPETAAAPANPQGQPAGSDMESASQKEQDPAAQQGQSAEQAVLGADLNDVQMAEIDADSADGQQQQQVGAASLCSSAAGHKCPSTWAQQS